MFTLAKEVVHVHLWEGQTEVLSFIGKAISTPCKISYQEQGKIVTLLHEKNIVTMIRKHPDYQMKFVFQQGQITNGIYMFPKESSKIYLQVKTNVLEWENDRVRIDYRLYPTNELFSYQLKFEVIE